MKLLTTSDWHLGSRLYGWDCTEEEDRFFKQLAEAVGAEKPDALVSTTETPRLQHNRYTMNSLPMPHSSAHRCRSSSQQAITTPPAGWKPHAHSSRDTK